MNLPVVLIVGTDMWTGRRVAACALQVGCEPVHEPTGAAALQAVECRRPALVVASSALPDMTVLELCRRLAASGGVRIVVLLARRDDSALDLLEAGADDCLPETVADIELRARMNAILRRAEWARRHERHAPGEVTVDALKRTVVVAGHRVRLREREFDLLLELVRRPGVVVTRDELLRRVWGTRAPMSGETLDVHVHRLRQKLGESGRQTRLIETVKGVGYRFREEPMAEAELQPRIPMAAAPAACAS